MQITQLQLLETVLKLKTCSTIYECCMKNICHNIVFNKIFPARQRKDDLANHIRMLSNWLKAFSDSRIIEKRK